MARANRRDVLADGAHHGATGSLSRVVGRVRGEFPQMVSFERWPPDVHVSARRLTRPQPRDQYQFVETPVCRRLRFGRKQRVSDSCVSFVSICLHRWLAP